MKMLDCPGLFEEADAEFVALATYGFDPVFFEQRLLRRRTLARARRILILVDAGEWQRAKVKDAPLRWINRRYLVVPIPRSTGVFHPKVGLLLSRDEVRVTCGSANLTRPGYAHNLELMNALSTPVNDKTTHADFGLARSVLAFLRAAVQSGGSSEACLAATWMDEELELNPLLQTAKAAEAAGAGTRFVHTLEGPLWPRLVERWEAQPPVRLMVISPFYDANHDLLARFVARWPKCAVRFIAQQETSLLDAPGAAAIHPRLALESLDYRSRRLHAKLIAWESANGIECLVGSANFTSAALDGRNVEACLWIDDASDQIEALFDRDLAPEAVAPSDFVPGTELPPEIEEPPPTPPLRLISAVLDEAGRIDVAYEQRLQRPPDSLAVSFRSASERLAAFSHPLPIIQAGTVVIKLPSTESLSLSTAIRATLVAEVGGERLESAPAWLVQVPCLTHEEGSGSGGDRLAQMRDSGEGLAEYTEQLARERGIQAVIEYLQSFDIRFFDGEGGIRLRRPFSVRMHDPFRPDLPPDWLLHLPDGTKAELRRAVLDFADRHERRCLRKHARRGNLNGLTNFLDVLRTVVQVLWTYHAQALLGREDVLDRIKKYVALATLGTAFVDDTHPGFLISLADHLRGERSLLKQRCTEEGFCEIVAAVLFVGQVLRSESGDAGAGPLANLPVFSGKVVSASSAAGLPPPGANEIRAGVRAIRVFTDTEFVRWTKWLDYTVPVR